ncbi:MAG: type II toxin-antitoxin system Phd/YefM family antitoxin [Patescibacteria group bacterium]|nr:type II toxin-antitoxin system Phd/YefM family antitoxin [Patescibacteria group bacterium]
MSIKNIISITKARNNLFKITDQIQKSGSYFTLTEHGSPKVVIMSAEEFDSWQETLEVMHDFPDLDKDIKEAEKAVKSGEYKKWTTLENLLAREGFLIADKSGKKYGVSNKNKTKRRKRVK